MALRSGDGSTEILTYKDPELISLIDSIDRITGQWLSVELLRCDPDTSSVACAGEQELIEYLRQHVLIFITANNFIDYSGVDPYKGPLRHSTTASD